MNIIANNEYKDNVYYSKYILNEGYIENEQDSVVCLIYTCILYFQDKVKNIQIYQEGNDYNYTITKFFDTYSSKDNFKESILSYNQFHWGIELNNGMVILGLNNREIQIENPILDKKLPIMFWDIEEKTFEFNKYSSNVLNYLINKEGLNKAVSVKFLQNLENFPNLYNEFISSIHGNEFVIPDKMITIEHYNVQNLTNEHRLNVVGAYNTLTNLIINPSEMLKILSTEIRIK